MMKMCLSSKEDWRMRKMEVGVIRIILFFLLGRGYLGNHQISHKEWQLSWRKTCLKTNWRIWLLTPEVIVFRISCLDNLMQFSIVLLDLGTFFISSCNNFHKLFWIIEIEIRLQTFGEEISKFFGKNEDLVFFVHIWLPEKNAADLFHLEKSIIPRVVIPNTQFREEHLSCQNQRSRDV